MNSRELKDHLYAQVARIGAAISSPKRLELLELLAQGEKPVEALAREAAIDVKLASAHLRVLKAAQLVLVRQERARAAITGSAAPMSPRSGWRCAAWPRRMWPTCNW